VATAEELNEQGSAQQAAGDSAGAEASYKAAIVADPSWSVPFYNLGLLYKYQGRWRESLDCNLQAAARNEQDQAAWWNLGIAATALGVWTEARRAWARCGMAVPSGDGPPDFNFGSTPVRLEPDGAAEVVWAHRMDPARAQILSVPLPTCAQNAGAVVLTDGAAEGYRRVRNVDYPVFNVLDVLQPSLLKKYVIELATADTAAIEALERLATGRGGAAEDWGRSTNILCAKCSKGIPHEHRDGPIRPAHPHCGLAARDDAHAEAIIREWLDRESGADLIRWYDASAEASNDA
jgi:tetratricopeptide (TPR) repeat protein